MAQPAFHVLFAALLISVIGAITSDASKHHKHHKHHRKHHNENKQSDENMQSAGAVANATAMDLDFAETSSDTKDGTIVRMFEHIQKALADAWKNKPHLESLQKTVSTEQALLSQQQQLLDASNDDFSVGEARNQVAQTAKMISQARQLMAGSKDAAVQSTQKALTEANFLKKQAEKEDAAEDAIIAKATAAKEVAKRRIVQAKTAIDGANQEAKFFMAKYADANDNKNDEAASQEAASQDLPKATKKPVAAALVAPVAAVAPVAPSTTMPAASKQQSLMAMDIGMDIFGKDSQIDPVKLQQLTPEQKLALLSAAEKVLAEKKQADPKGKTH